MESNIETGLFLGLLGDIIGYGNGFNEFNNNTYFTRDNFGENYEQIGAEYSNQMVFDFFYNGGFANHPDKTWTISDDTLMSMATLEVLIEWDQKDINELVKMMKKKYMTLIDSKKKLHDFEVKYKAGLTTITSIKKLSEGIELQYNDKSGGSGAVMKSGVIGLILDDEDLIAKVAISIAIITHPNAIAFLGSVAIALFAMYARKRIRPEKWHIDMLHYIEGKKIDEYVKSIRPDFYDFYLRDKKIFLNKWHDYIEDKFDDQTHMYIKSAIMKYPSQRSLYYNKFSYKKDTQMYPGAGGDDSVIIAYDCFMDSDRSWEKCLVYSALHVGDSDTTGSLAGFLYGLYHGHDSVSLAVYDDGMDYKHEMKELLKKIKSL